MQNLDGPGGSLGKDAPHRHGQRAIPVHQDQGNYASQISRVVHHFDNIGVTGARQMVIGEGRRRPDVHQLKGVGQILDEPFESRR